MIITISGMPGSGKSTVGKLLARRLGFAHYSAGDLRGKMALSRGLTIDELNALGEKEEWTDKEADGQVKKLGETEDNFVIDGRVAHLFIPRAFKVFLDVDSRAGAERVFAVQNSRADEKPKASLEEMIAAHRARIASDNRRYRKYYGVEYTDKSRYDLVIDTTKIEAEDVVSRIFNHVIASEAKQSHTRANLGDRRVGLRPPRDDK